MEIVSSMCRICMKDNVTLLYIFEDLDDLQSESLASKIEKCTTLTMHPNDGLPDTICGYCTRDVEQAYNLQKLAMSTNKILSRMFLTVEEVVEPAAIVAAKRVVDMTTMNIRKDIVNSILSNKRRKVETEFITDDNILVVKGEIDSDQEHEEDGDVGLLDEMQVVEEEEGEEEEELVYAQDQGMEIEVEVDDNYEQVPVESEEQEATEDESAIHAKKLVLIKRKVHAKRQPKEEKEEALQCRVCMKYIHGSASMDQHMKVVHDIFRYECDECDEKFLSALQLKEHKDAVHPSESGVAEFECGICRRKFNCHKTLEQHGQLHEKKSKKLAQRRSEMTKYKRSYYEARCETCGIDGFESAEERRKHHAAHNGVYACKHCDKVFGFDSSYHTHFMNVHQGIKFECDLCYQQFTLASSLKRHKLTIHTNVFRFQCSYCDKPFKQKTQMETHVRSIHTKEKPFKCNFCELCFSDQSTLIKHRKTHKNFASILEKEKPKTLVQSIDTIAKSFKCNLCKACFSDHSMLIKHRKTHTKTETLRVY